MSTSTEVRAGMEVSNSTEQSTDYRVGANGGGTP